MFMLAKVEAKREKNGLVKKQKLQDQQSVVAMIFKLTFFNPICTGLF